MKQLQETVRVFAVHFFKGAQLSSLLLLGSFCALLLLSPATSSKAPLPLEEPAWLATSGKAAVQDVTLAEQQQSLINYFSTRYRVSKVLVRQVVSAAFAEGPPNNIDPLLIMSVVAIESSFNPYAESSAGAQGVMQLMAQYHGGEVAYLEDGLYDTTTNIRIGAKVLSTYIRQAGSIEKGLLRYVGSGEDSIYPEKVLTEYHRLRKIHERGQNSATTNT